MGIMVLMIIIGPMFNDYDYRSNDCSALNQSPSAEHWFGTDNLGRDIWTRLWQGGRVLLFIALLATIIPEVIGWIIGGISGWLGSARYTRGRILQLKSMEHVMAAKTLGASPMRIILLHLIPNTLNISVISIAMGIPSVIFAEAFYSYIGLGIAPPSPSCGQMIKMASQVFMQYPYQFLFPCACVASPCCAAT